MNDNHNFLANDVANLESHIHALLEAYPELADDAELKADMLEGETNLHAVLDRLVGIERDALLMQKAIAERAKDLAARKARMERRQEAMRVLIFRLMKAAGKQKETLAEATVSIGKGRASVEITDEAALPRWAYETVRKPDKKAIMERLAANKNVSGAVLKEAGEVLSVRAS